MPCESVKMAFETPPLPNASVMSGVRSTASRCNLLVWYQHAPSSIASFNNIPRRQLRTKIKNKECAAVGIGNEVHLNNMFGVASFVQSVPSLILVRVQF